MWPLETSHFAESFPRSRQNDPTGRLATKRHEDRIISCEFSRLFVADQTSVAAEPSCFPMRKWPGSAFVPTVDLLMNRIDALWDEWLNPG
jgi:hypothetical protein